MPGNAAIADNAGNAGNPKRQIAFGSGDCPTEVKRVTDWEYLAARNQAKRTIERSRHHAVREMAAKCPVTPPSPTTPVTRGTPNAKSPLVAATVLPKSIVYRVGNTWPQGIKRNAPFSAVATAQFAKWRPNAREQPEPPEPAPTAKRLVTLDQ
jgi:hypothetical protein